jgi:hypothetical protein
MSTFSRVLSWIRCSTHIGMNGSLCLLLCTSLFVTVGCQDFGLSKLKNKMSLRSQNADDDKDDDDEFDEDFETKIKVPMIGDYTTFSGLHRVVLEGVGLVVGLKGTGDDPPPSQYREALMDDMRRRSVRGEEAKRLLASPNTALVVVRAYLPPLIQKGDQFDIDVRIPGDTKATSLNGGRLMETILSETAIVANRGTMKGRSVSKARGPILISTGEGEKENLAGVLKRGRILGGGVSLIDRDMAIYVRTEFRTLRHIRKLSQRIGERFYAYDKRGIREALTKPQTDQRIVLKVHPNYRHNFPRYLRVIENIAYRETTVQRRVRLQRLKRDLLNPAKAEFASLQLEAIGKESIPTLKTGLKSNDLECRFHSALSLAYLDNADGIEILREAAQKERAFRVFAFAALAIIEDPQANLALRDLMSVHVATDGTETDSAETRYGAFRSLWTLDPSDTFISGKKLNEEYWLHAIDSDGDPMVHITHRKRPEVVLFGKNQEFQTPMAVRAGNNIIVTSRPGSDQITLSRFTRRGADQRKVVSKRISEVIRAAAELGASYPDISQMLVQADRQQNLPGRFEIDALPQSGRLFFRDGDRTRKGRTGQTPNLFERNRDEQPESEDGEGVVEDGGEQSEPTADNLAANENKDDSSGFASLVDARSSALGESDKKRGGIFGWFKRDKKPDESE